MPVVSYASISDSPPLVAVACNPDSFTCKLVMKAKAFSLAVLSAKYIPELERLATLHGAAVKDKLEAAGLAHGRGEVLPVPVPEAAEAVLECKVGSARKTGDHLLVIGLVKAARTTSAFTDAWDFQGYAPVLYTGWEKGLTTYDRRGGPAGGAGARHGSAPTEGPKRPSRKQNG